MTASTFYVCITCRGNPAAALDAPAALRPGPRLLAAEGAPSETASIRVLGPATTEGSA